MYNTVWRTQLGPLSVNAYRNSLLSGNVFLFCNGREKSLYIFKNSEVFISIQVSPCRTTGR